MHTKEQGHLRRPSGVGGRGGIDGLSSSFPPVTNPAGSSVTDSPTDGCSDGQWVVENQCVPAHLN